MSINEEFRQHTLKAMQWRANPVLMSALSKVDGTGLTEIEEVELSAFLGVITTYVGIIRNKPSQLAVVNEMLKINLVYGHDKEGRAALVFADMPRTVTWTL